MTDEKLAEYIEKYGAKYSRKNWTYYDGSFYCQSKAVSMGGTTFNNGVRIETFKYYWFKLEPIVWEMVNYGNAFVSAKVLDYQVYHTSTKTRYINERNVNPNNYQYCYLREWLNNDFINLAFSLGDNYLETSDVDNSSVSTATLRVNNNACQNTFDKVYVPCHRDIKDGEAVFNFELLSAKATDYAIAQGTYYNYPSYNAEYWTRSPDGTYIDTAFMMNEDSYVVTTCVDALCGVRPMISIAGNPLY